MTGPVRSEAEARQWLASSTARIAEVLRRLEVSGQPVDWYEPAPLPDCYARLPTTPGHCLAEARNLRVVDPELRIALGAAWLEDGSQIQHVFNVAAADTLDEGADAVRAALAD